MMGRRLYNSGRALVEQIESIDLPLGQLALWSLGNEGFVVKGAHAEGVFAVDPYLSRRIEADNPGTEFVRAFDPPLLPEELAEVAETLFITHEHDDHFDPGTVGPAAASRAGLQLVIPAALHEAVSFCAPAARLHDAQVGRSLELGALRVWPLPAAHPTVEEDAAGRSRRVGYCIELNGVRLYHAGDTVMVASLVEALESLAPQVMILPINGGDYFRAERGIVGNMSYREAVDLAARVGTDLLIPCHFDLFPNNRERPAYFVDWLLESQPAQRFHLFTAGELFVYVAPRARTLKG